MSSFPIPPSPHVEPTNRASSLDLSFFDRVVDGAWFFYGGLVFAAIEGVVEVYYFHFEDINDLKFRNMHGTQLGLLLLAAGVILAIGSIAFCLSEGIADFLTRRAHSTPDEGGQISGGAARICLASGALYILAYRAAALLDDNRRNDAVMTILLVWMVCWPVVAAIVSTRRRFGRLQPSQGA